MVGHCAPIIVFCLTFFTVCISDMALVAEWLLLSSGPSMMAFRRRSKNSDASAWALVLIRMEMIIT